MIDIHAHILPGVDDGPETLSEAVRMCRMAVEDGCEAIIATPHQRHPLWENDDLNRLGDLAAELQRAVGSSIQILLGAEIRVDSELLDHLELASWFGLRPLASSRYLLVELDRSGVGPDPFELAHELLLEGWRPVFAHPELLPWFGEDESLLGSLHEAGALFQITAMSVLGEMGRRPRKIAERLLDAGWADFLASDCHAERGRKPGLTKAKEVVARRWGSLVAERLTRSNPRAVLDDRTIGRLQLLGGSAR